MLRIRTTIPWLYFYSFIAIITISFPLSMILEKSVPNTLTKFYYLISCVWLGMMFLFFILISLFKLINIFFKPSQMISAVVIIALVILISVYAIINALSINVKTIEINMPGIDKEYKIVQLSDVHVGSIRSTKHLENLVRIANEQKPDIVVFTGDLVDGSAIIYPHMFDSINSLKAPTYFIIGNHEVYEGVDYVLATLNQTKIKVLRNQAVEYQGLQIIGVDYSHEKNYLKKSLLTTQIAKDKTKILLYHTPSEVETAKAFGINLMLSGHTHNGQIFPFNFLTKIPFPRNHGFYDIDGMKLYVSPGAGTWGPPMRVGSRNEISVIVLKPLK